MPVTWGDTGTGWIMTNGNLDGNSNAGGWSMARSSISFKTGKWYLEIECRAGALGTSFGCGVMDDTTPAGAGMDNYLTPQCGGTRQDAFNFNNGVFTPATADGFGSTTAIVGTRIGIAANCDNQEMYMSANGVWIGTSDPAIRTNPRYTWTGHAGINIYAMVVMISSTARIHPDVATQSYPVPTGYLAWSAGQAAAQARVVVMA